MRTKLILAMAMLGSAVGCSGPPTEPTRAQEWLTLAEYKVRAAQSGFPVNPVVSVPAGAEVALRISRKPDRLFGAGFDRIFFGALEPIDDQMVTIRLRAAKEVHLDLEHLLASTDRKTWMPLAAHFFPYFRDSRVTVATPGSNPEVVVPVSVTVERLSMTRDILSDVTFR